MWDLNLPLRDVLARLALAMAFGALVGLERQIRHKAAGLRTMTLVGLGAAMFVLAGEEVIASSAPTTAVPTIMPVIAAVVTGVGFLGAGTIMRDAGRVAGVTTAAAVWVTAGIGIVCGLGELVLATLCAAATFVTLLVVRIVEGPLVRGEHDSGGDQASPK